MEAIDPKVPPIKVTKQRVSSEIRLLPMIEFLLSILNKIKDSTLIKSRVKNKGMSIR
ncbi:hypothetical protein EB1_11620 [Empedobacter brevis NBRC 14943 = ATCC 43319]|uniref:Uncharacterized protein n=1 Tax=Empedobacter brevis NBRC 14943 = ATCC 43319 TaxID=1218108 RepID=A0A511NEY6_9FLAO|nr:hypothetical protein EB1_11620 [Empedobacter brevis NBRC 14943 = ATCC 43319]